MANREDRRAPREIRDPGPIDDSVLTEQHHHISAKIWRTGVVTVILSNIFSTIKISSTGIYFFVVYMQSVQTLRARSSGVADMRFHRVHYLVERRLVEFGFYGLYNLTKLRLDWGLLMALAERWRPETHTFHMTVGECTVTLQVHFLLTFVSNLNYVKFYSFS